LAEGTASPSSAGTKRAGRCALRSAQTTGSLGPGMHSAWRESPWRGKNSTRRRLTHWTADGAARRSAQRGPGQQPYRESRPTTIHDHQRWRGSECRGAGRLGCMSRSLSLRDRLVIWLRHRRHLVEERRRAKALSRATSAAQPLRGPRRVASRRGPPGGPGTARAGVRAPLPRLPNDLGAGAEAQPPTEPGGGALDLPPAGRRPWRERLSDRPAPPPARLDR